MLVISNSYFELQVDNVSTEAGITVNIRYMYSNDAGYVELTGIQSDGSTAWKISNAGTFEYPEEWTHYYSQGDRLFFSNNGQLKALDVRTGKILWESSVLGYDLETITETDQGCDFVLTDGGELLFCDRMGGGFLAASPDGKVDFMETDLKKYADNLYYWYYIDSYSYSQNVLHVQVKAKEYSDSSISDSVAAFDVRVSAPNSGQPENSHETYGPFKDVYKDSWFVDSVKYVISHNLMNGTSSTTFSPDDYTTRAMIAAILYRMEGEPAASSRAFGDVPAGQWYTKAMAWAADAGILAGDGSNRYYPVGTVTREQVVTIIYRYAGMKGIDVSGRESLSIFSDRYKISRWAEDAVSWGLAAGIIGGMPDNIFAPKDECTRATVATILMNFGEEFGI